MTWDEPTQILNNGYKQYCPAVTFTYVFNWSTVLNFVFAFVAGLVITQFLKEFLIEGKKRLLLALVVVIAGFVIIELLQ